MSAVPKRVGDLFNTMFTLDSLYDAYLKSRVSKRYKFSVMQFERDLGSNLSKLLDDLIGGSYEPKPYKSFYVYEPKPRLIHAPHFRDVIVQRAMYDMLYPIIDKSFLVDSFGCRVGYGTHRAADKVQIYLRQSSHDSYTLQMDIRKFFYRIDRKVLLLLWEKKIKDKRVLDLILQFTEYEGTGIPIGNLMSQISALVYLNELDHFVKRELNIKKYVRYVDDFVVFDLSKNDAYEILGKIQEFLSTNLMLELSKYRIAPINRGVNFCGFRTWRSVRFVRKHSMMTFKRSLKCLRVERVVSCLGHAKSTTGYRKMLKMAFGFSTDLPISLLNPTRRLQ
jgi:retron-type reverse transcriptase